ncbi:MAG: ankyrin repeat domain-containing protein [Acidobacteria bacterium]|nr:ankyrin repeat domain-containing protein [Acidobacteriota bacterium]
MRYAAIALLLTTLCAAAPKTGSNLPDAAEHKDLPALQALLKQGADPNAAQTDGMTALHWAAYLDQLPIAKALLDAGADPAPQNRYGVTPLSMAAVNGSAPMIALLLDKGADANTALPGGETALMTASRTGDLASVKLLLQKGADAKAAEMHGQTALMWAAAEGHAEVVELLAEYGADVRQALPSGFTPLFFAARQGHIPVVRALLDLGADVNAELQPTEPSRQAPRTGSTPLHVAVQNCHYELAAYLLERGADPSAHGPGYTALHVMTEARKPGIGDNDPAPPGSGSMDSLELVRRLAAAGADLDFRMTRQVNFSVTRLNKLGATAFLLAAQTADAPLLRLLAELGADTTIPNQDNTPPIIVAAGVGTRSPGEDAGTEPETIEAIDVLLDLGADINAVDDHGETVMHAAAYKNLPLLVEHLAEKGADITVWNKENEFGWTPLTIARGYRFGNFKPSAVTVEALVKVMQAAGVPIPPDTGNKTKEIY